MFKSTFLQRPMVKQAKKPEWREISQDPDSQAIVQGLLKDLGPPNEVEFSDGEIIRASDCVPGNPNILDFDYQWENNHHPDDIRYNVYAKKGKAGQYTAWGVPYKEEMYPSLAERRPSQPSEESNRHHMLGIELRADEKWDAAIKEFQEALRINPNNTSVYFDLGHSLGEIGEWTEAVKTFRKAMHWHADFVGGHNWLAWALEGVGDWRNALKEFRMACQFEPDNTYAKAGYERLMERAMWKTAPHSASSRFGFNSEFLKKKT